METAAKEVEGIGGALRSVRRGLNNAIEIDVGRWHVTLIFSY
jgi:hypothetical protein